MNDKKFPDTNECVYKVVKHCYYQDTARQLNQQQCTNCVLARIEKHLFAIAGSVVKNNSKNKVATAVKHVQEELRGLPIGVAAAGERVR